MHFEDHVPRPAPSPSCAPAPLPGAASHPLGRLSRAARNVRSPVAALARTIRFAIIWRFSGRGRTCAPRPDPGRVHGDTPVGGKHGRTEKVQLSRFVCPLGQPEDRQHATQGRPHAKGGRRLDSPVGAETRFLGRYRQEEGRKQSREEVCGKDDYEGQADHEEDRHEDSGEEDHEEDRREEDAEAGRKEDDDQAQCRPKNDCAAENEGREEGRANNEVGPEEASARVIETIGRRNEDRRRPEDTRFRHQHPEVCEEGNQESDEACKCHGRQEGDRHQESGDSGHGREEEGNGPGESAPRQGGSEEGGSEEGGTEEGGSEEGGSEEGGSEEGGSEEDGSEEDGEEAGHPEVGCYRLDGPGTQGAAEEGREEGDAEEEGRLHPETGRPETGRAEEVREESRSVGRDNRQESCIDGRTREVGQEGRAEEGREQEGRPPRQVDEGDRRSVGRSHSGEG